LRDIRGYDPPQPSKRFLRLWQSAEPRQIDWTSFELQELNPTALQLASVLGARYVMLDPGTQLEEAGLGGTSSRGLRPVYRGIEATVYENARSAPRALVAARVHVVDSEQEAAEALLAPEFDPRSEAVVERGAEGAGALGAAVRAGGSRGSGAGRSGAGARAVAVDDVSPADVRMRARLARPGLVVLNDSWAPGWSVQVDGRAARAVRVNDAMRGVAVGAGAHVVEWRYRVPGLRAGMVVSLVVALALVVLGLGMWRSRQRA
jgi:hypothetical protein